MTLARRLLALLFVLGLVTTGVSARGKLFQQSQAQASQQDDQTRTQESGQIPNKSAYLARYPAQWTDNLLKLSLQAPAELPYEMIVARIYSTVFFPALLTVDLAHYSSKALYTLMLAGLNKATRKEVQESRDLVRNCYLAIFNSPLGILSPDIVSQHFVPEQKQPGVLEPYGKYYAAKVEAKYPETVQELQQIVRHTQLAGKKIAVAGAGLSQGKHILPPGTNNIVLHMDKFNDIVINPATKTAVVGAGATWGSIQDAANGHGLALQVQQASNVFSVGGSLSVNCHGWDHKAGALVNTVKAITLVTPSGAVTRLTPNDTLFGYVAGGFGGFGIMVSVELQLTDNTILVRESHEINPEQYCEYFANTVVANPNIDMHLYRLSLDPKNLFKTGIAVNYVRYDDQQVSTPLVPEKADGSRIERVALHVLRRMPYFRGTAWQGEKMRSLKTWATSRNEHMRPPINSVFNNSRIDCEWLQEYFVKGEDLVEFLQFLGKKLTDNNVALFNASVRFVKQDTTTKLNYANGSDMFAIVLFFSQSLIPAKIKQTREWVQETIDWLIGHGGTFYLPYQHFATPEQFKACYPGWQDAVAMKQQLDPETIFANGLWQDYLSPASAPVPYSFYRNVFNKEHGQRAAFTDFLKNIFMQLHEDDFYEVIDEVLEDRSLTDEQIYEQLCAKIAPARRGMLKLALFDSLISVSEIQKDLSEQVKKLMGAQKTVNGYVEIGYPGRMVRALKSKLNMSGPVIVVNDKERLSDYAQSGLMRSRPYNTFVPLNDYEPISATAIPSASVDMVSCFIGLHHIPTDKLDGFVTSIKRILRPGGSFILMDHDAGTPEMKELVTAVHSVFNAATRVSPEEDKTEVRNFQSLATWIDLLARHGLMKTVVPEGNGYVRAGDSTRNTTMRFVKAPETEAEVEVVATQTPDAKQQQLQTYMTGPEWYNVRAAQAYGRFVKKNNAAHFPFMQSTIDFWTVFKDSWNAARKHHSFTEVLTSEYTLVDLFIGTSMTAEYLTKAALYTPLSWLTPKSKQPLDPADKLGAALAAPAQCNEKIAHDYGQFIISTPFYMFPYLRSAADYWKSFATSWSTARKDNSLLSVATSRHTLSNLATGAALTTEMLVKGALATPIAYFYAGGEQSIHMVVKNETGRPITDIDPRITVIKEYPHNLLHIKMPRYMPTTEILCAFAEKDIVVKTIAGNKKIQLDVIVGSTVANPAHGVSGCTKLSEIPVPADPDHKYVALEVDVEQMGNVINRLKAAGIAIEYFHDF